MGMSYCNTRQWVWQAVFNDYTRYTSFIIHGWFFISTSFVVMSGLYWEAALQTGHLKETWEMVVFLALWACTLVCNLGLISVLQAGQAVGILCPKGRDMNGAQLNEKPFPFEKPCTEAWAPMDPLPCRQSCIAFLNGWRNRCVWAVMSHTNVAASIGWKAFEPNIRAVSRQKK